MLVVVNPWVLLVLCVVCFGLWVVLFNVVGAVAVVALMLSCAAGLAVLVVGGPR